LSIQRERALIPFRPRSPPPTSPQARPATRDPISNLQSPQDRQRGDLRGERDEDGITQHADDFTRRVLTRAPMIAARTTDALALTNAV